MTSIDNKRNDDKATTSRQSIIEAPFVSAFGDDYEDYKRVTEQKDETKNDKQKSDKNYYGTKFGITTFSKAPKALEEMKAVFELENRSPTMPPEDGQNNVDTDSSENTSEHSADLSDDKVSNSESCDTWQSFSLNTFHVKSSHGYCCAPLQHPLLPKTHKSDHLASLASWVTILRIMGDLPEVDLAETLRIVAYSKPIVLMVKENFAKKYTNKDIEDAYRCYTELFTDPSVSETKNIPFLPKNKESMLEKIQFITALGIMKANLRDELYCQVWKQLTNNPSRNSFNRGWVVLFMLAGSFLPSEKFAPVLLQILKDGPTDHAPRVERLLRRTFTVGTRGQPPSWLEFQAAKNSKPVHVPVILMNGTRLLVDVDSATTANELCLQISHRIGLTERNGFSIYITLGQMISCLGHGNCRIMDAICECEQNTRRQGMRESSSTWRLYLRKEFFTPWYDPQYDTCATDLIYQQIMRGVSIGEYKCEKEAVLVLMAAQKYYIDFSTDTDETKIKNFLSKFLPKEQMNSHDMAYWVEKIKQEIENDFLTDKPSTISLKADIVKFAINKWHNLFARFYEASTVHGPRGTWNNVVIGISCKGFNFMDEHENVKVHLTFIEITKVDKDKNSLIISTLQGDKYIAITMHTEDLFALLSTFQLGLRERSRYAIALRDIPQSGIAIGIQKGDLVKLDKSFGEFKDSEAYTGISLKNKKQGSIPRDVIFILPTIEEPPSNMMGMLVMQLRKDLSEITSTMPPVRGPESYTLHNYSKIHFRQSSDSTVTKLFSKTSKKDKDTIWQFSKEPLKKPLLKRTSMRDELCKAACRSFLAIQIYMGEAINKDNISEIQLLNDDVIDVAIRNKYLQEEIFCQVIKQLTQNPNKLSEERGWQLLYLLLSCTYPQTDLSNELESFLKTSQHSYAKKCLAKMHITKSQGRRYTPPHELEHNALKDRNTNFEYTVLFPDQSIQKIEVDSSTRMNHLLSNISKKLQLQNADEYGLFFGLKDKVISAIQWDYFFDNLSHIQRHFMKQQKDTVSNEASSLPALIFMKKIWINATPGQDKLADIKFHFPQEVPNYLRGYHKCSTEDSVQLGSLLFLAKYGNEKQPLENIESTLSSLIPDTVVSQKKPAVWKQELQTSISKLKFSSREDAKVAFLKSLHNWETYGSVFFEVKQRSSKQLPRNLLLAINHNGVLFINADTRDVLVTYSFNKIPNWAFDDYSFTLAIGEGSSLTKFYMETKVGHNIDDLIMTYIAYIMNTQIKNKPTYAGIVVGESLC